MGGGSARESLSRHQLFVYELHSSYVITCDADPVLLRHDKGLRNPYSGIDYALMF